MTLFNRELMKYLEKEVGINNNNIWINVGKW